MATYFGTSGDDSITGSASADSIFGGGGNDTLTGNGSDILAGGSGKDTASFVGFGTGLTIDLEAGSAEGGGDTLTLSSIENVIGSAYADSITGDTDDNLLAGGGGSDTISGGKGSDTVSFDGLSGNVLVDLTNGVAATIAGNLTLNSIENVIGNASNTSFFDDLNNNLLKGGNGGNIFAVSGGNDTLIGGTGYNAVYFSSIGISDGGVSASSAGFSSGITVDLGAGHASSDTYTISLSGIDDVYGTRYNDIIIGDAGNNFFMGVEGDDLLDGGAGNDNLSAYGGNDTLIGGEGNDTARLENSHTSVYVNLGTGAGTTDLGDSLKLSSIENVVGSAYADSIVGDSSDNVLDGWLGDDTLIVGSGDDTLVGNDGTDTVSFTGHLDTVIVDLSDGAAATGTNTLKIQSIENVVSDAAYNILYDNIGSNVLQGGNYGNYFAVCGGNDTIIGGSGNDFINFAEGSSAYGGLTAYSLGFSSGVTVNLGAGTASGDTYTLALSEIDNVTGTIYGDVLVGDARSNEINGLAGDDFLDGGAGDDTLYVHSGNNTLHGGDGIDLVRFETTYGLTCDLVTGVATDGASTTMLAGMENVMSTYYTDHITGDAHDNTIFILAGNDTVAGGGGTDTLNFETFVSNVNVNLGAGSAAGGGFTLALSSLEVVIGSYSADSIAGDSGNNVLSGSGGNDTILGGRGNDTLDGGDDSGDQISYVGTTSGVAVSLATGLVSGGAGADSVSGFEQVLGSGYADSLTGGIGGDSLNGGAGNDLLDGGLGDDSLHGNTGTDTASYAWATGAVSVNLGLATAQNTGAGGVDLLTGIENLTGGSGNDSLAGNGSANVVTGGAGDDTILGGLGNDTLLGGAGDLLTYAGAASGVNVNLASGVVSGGAGADSVSGFAQVLGSSYADTLTGAGGNDTLAGGAGNDSIQGGDGRDLADYSLAASAVEVNLTSGGSSGGGLGTDSLAGIENLRGGDYADTLTGNGGDNIFSGGLGNDSLVGGTGADTADYSGASSAVQVNLTTGRATGGAGNDSMSGIENALTGSADDSHTGSAGNNALLAGAGNDTLIGGAGFDCLLGGDGKDRMTLGTNGSMAFGDTGADVLVAGAGNSVLAGGKANDTINTAAGANVLLFNAGDGMDIVSSTDTDRDDTLSLGGGITRSELTLSRNGTNLILRTETGDALIFANWYATTNARTSVLNLQLIEAAATDFNAGSSDPLLSSKVLCFNFTAIVADFDAARAKAVGPPGWSMDASMTAHLSSSSNTAAIGGDFAYQYGTTGTLAAVGTTGAQHVLSGAGFGTTAQNLQSDAALGAGSLKLG